MMQGITNINTVIPVAGGEIESISYKQPSFAVILLKKVTGTYTGNLPSSCPSLSIGCINGVNPLEEPSVLHGSSNLCTRVLLLELGPSKAFYLHSLYLAVLGSAVPLLILPGVLQLHCYLYMPQSSGTAACGHSLCEAIMNRQHLGEPPYSLSQLEIALCIFYTHTHTPLLRSGTKQPDGACRTNESPTAPESPTS